MTTPMRPVPDGVARWIARRRWLRGGDAVIACTLAWAAAVAVLGAGRVEPAAVVALGVVGLGSMLQPLRVRWRPLSGWVGLRVSRGLRPGDRAWYVAGQEAGLVMVTARRGFRIVIARPDFGEDEAISVRRTRVLLLPADAR